MLFQNPKFIDKDKCTSMLHEHIVFRYFCIQMCKYRDCFVHLYFQNNNQADDSLRKKVSYFANCY
jgi:hypothetical protein